MAEQEIGKVTHFFGKVSVGTMKLTAELKVGDTIKIKTRTGEFTQVIDSMQIDRAPVTTVPAGGEPGIKLAQPVKEGDTVFKVS